MKNTTNVVVIIDQSGSMSSLKNEVINNFNEFIEEQQKSEGEIELTTVFFNSHINKFCESADIKHTKKLTSDDYNPSSMTRLYDAIGITLDEHKAKMKELPKKERPEKNILVIITDGQENSSREYQKEDITKKIAKLEKKNWLVMYLGANQDSFAESKKMGVRAKSTMNYDFSTSGMRSAWSKISDTTTLYSASMDAKSFVDDYDIDKVKKED